MESCHSRNACCLGGRLKLPGWLDADESLTEEAEPAGDRLTHDQAPFPPTQRCTNNTHALVVAPRTTGFSYSSFTLCVLTGSSAKRCMISSRPRSSVMLFSYTAEGEYSSWIRRCCSPMLRTS